MQTGNFSNKHIDPTSILRLDYQRWRQLFQSQPRLIQHFLETQARNLADGLTQSASQARFSLPDHIICAAGESLEPGNALSIPIDAREHMAGGLIERLNKTALNVTLREKLNELEASANPAIATGAGLIRFTTAVHLVHGQLPDGRTVHYRALEDEEIPSIPDYDPDLPISAITEPTDAITEKVDETLNEKPKGEGQRGELQVPYVPAALRFFLPQWVAFDEEDRLLTGSLNVIFNPCNAFFYCSILQSR